MSARIQKPTPAFATTALLPDGSFKDVSYEKDYAGKYLVLFFYPLDFTFVCPTEIIAFSDRAKEFADINCNLVVACSIDSQFCHLAWTKQEPRAEAHVVLRAHLRVGGCGCVYVWVWVWVWVWV